MRWPVSGMVAAPISLQILASWPSGDSWLARKPVQVQMHRNPAALKTIQLRSRDETCLHRNPSSGHLKQKIQAVFKSDYKLTIEQE